MLSAILLSALGIIFVIWPRFLLPLGERQHAERLRELRAGEPETYFEELRSLEAYSPTRGSLAWRRALGALMIAVAVGVSIIPRLVAGG